LIKTVISKWVWSAEQVWEIVRREMEESGIVWTEANQMEKICEWMGRKIRWGGVESNKMCWLLAKIEE
jgi:hypothetical protein